MTEKMNVAKIFGENVFNDKVMQERLPKKVYKALRKTIDEGKELDPMVADVVAEAMKNWAVEKGATHYTHIFQPLTGVTAEKHDAFITAVFIGSGAGLPMFMGIPGETAKGVFSANEYLTRNNLMKAFRV